MASQYEVVQRLLATVNVIDEAVQLDQAITPVLARVARRLHRSNTRAIADTIIRAKHSMPDAIFTTIDQIAESLTAPHGSIDDLRQSLTEIFESQFQRAQLQQQVLKVINEAARESDIEPFLSELLIRLKNIVSEIEPHHLAKAILDSRHELRDDQFTNVDQLTNVVVSALLPSALVHLIKSDLLRGLEEAPWTTHPALLLPLRIETRFMGRKLMVRVYPDQFSVNMHRPQLSAVEYDSIRSYVECPQEHRPASWRMLSTRFGPARAAWLVTWSSDHDFTGQPPEFRPASWTDPPRFQALPARFCVFAYRGDKVIRKISRPVRDNIALVGTFQSIVRLELGGNPGTVVSSGSLVVHNPTGVLWALNSSSTIGANRVALVDATAMSGTSTIDATNDWTIYSPIVGWESVRSLNASSLVEGLFDDSSKWVYDFSAAVRDGLGVELELEDDDFDMEGVPLGFDKVIVVGVKWDTANSSALQLERLLQAHRFTDGVGFLGSGTPTNNTELKTSGYSTREDHERSYRIHVEGPQNWNAQTRGEVRTNAHRLARALGVDAELLRFVEGSGETGDSLAREMNTIIWPVTGDYYLRHLLSGAVSDQELSHLTYHHVQFVRGGGALPSLRVGKQPYGVLPVTRILPQNVAEGGWIPWEGDAGADEGFDACLHGIVTRFYTRWLQTALRSQSVPRIKQNDPDPDRTLLQILSMQPQCVSYRARPFVDERFIAWLLVVLRNYAFGSGSPYEDTGMTPAQWMLMWSEAWNRAKDRTASLLTELASSDGGVPSASFKIMTLLRMLAWFEGSIDPVPFVEDSSNRENKQSVSEYLLEIASSGRSAAQSLFATIAQDALSLAPSSAACAEVKEALQLLAGSSALEFLNAVTVPQQIVDQIKDDPDRHPERRGYGVRRKLAERILARRDELGRYTSLQQVDDIFGVGPDTLHDILYSFEEFQGQPDFDRMFREALDVASHRVDAWVTSFATKRLEGMRLEQQAPTGIHLGAYGYVEDLHVRQSPTSEGYFHAPSSDQAATAAVLYNAFLTHDPSKTSTAGDNRQENPFRINLSSTRVRDGLRVIKGVREGQSQGAIHGYQFERSLRKRSLHLMQYVDDFRECFPTVAHKVTHKVAPDEEASTVAARTVLDGNALALSYRGLARTDSGELDLSVTYPEDDSREALRALLITSGDDLSAIKAELDRLDDSLDAVSDLFIAEGVYQAVRGNYERAGAVLAANSGDQMPSDLEVVETPVTGRRYTNRICMIFNEMQHFDPRLDPRAAAEPRVAAWFSDLLGDMSNIGVGVDFWEEETDELVLKRVNVNTADVKELAALHCITQQLAQAIVDERKRWPFKQLSDLTRVRGIGKETVADLIDKATTGYVERINVNVASSTLLGTLPGIGPELANYIVAGRPFKGVDDLIRINRINMKTLDVIRPWVIAPIVDLNVATHADLEAVPGLGKTLANRIVEAREHGELEGIADLLSLDGFDQVLLDKIEPFVSTDFDCVRLEELSIDNEQCFSQTDFLYMAQSTPGGGATELEQRIAQVVRRRYGLPASQRVEVHPTRHGNYTHSLGDAVELAQQCLRPLGTARPIVPHQMCHPGAVEIEGYSLLEFAAFRKRARDAQEMVAQLIELFEQAKFVVPLRFHGTVGVQIPVGTQLRCKVSGANWKTTTACTLSSTTDDDLAIADVEAMLTAVEGEVSAEPGPDWVVEPQLTGLERVVSLGPSRPLDVVGISSLLRRAAQYGIEGTATSVDDDPQVSIHFDNTYAELHKRQNASFELTPKLDVNSAGLASLIDFLGERIAEAIYAAKPQGGYADIETLLHLTGLEGSDSELVQRELTVSGISPTPAIEKLLKAMRSLFGKSFVVLPEFVPQGAAELDNTLSKNFSDDLSRDPLRGLGEDRLRLWLQQCGEVQTSISTLEDTLIYADAWSQVTTGEMPPSLVLELAQLPYDSGRAWIGLSDDERGHEPVRPDWNRSPLSLVLASYGTWPKFVHGAGNITGAVTAGMVIDEWSELIPAKEVETSVAFQYDAPGNQAPQALLLAVPGVVNEVAGLWTPEELANIVKDTMDLAKVRSVDLDALASSGAASPSLGEEPVGAIMPGIYLPVNASRPGWERDIAMNSIEEWVDGLEDTNCIRFEDFDLGEEFTARTEGIFNFVGLGGFAPQVVDHHLFDLRALKIDDAGLQITLPLVASNLEMMISFLPSGTQGIISLRDSADVELVQYLGQHNLFRPYTISANVANLSKIIITGGGGFASLFWLCARAEEDA